MKPSKCQERDCFDKKRKPLGSLHLSDAHSAGEQGDGYLTGSLTSGVEKLEEKSDVVKRGKGYISSDSQVQLTCMHP